MLSRTVGKAMKGHGFLSYLSGAGAAEPLSAARGQQLRRVGVLLNLREQDPESKAYIAAFLKQLEELGWRVGSNLQVDYRWTAGDASRAHQHATELIALAPDVILAADGSHVGSLQQLTQTIPVVFVQVTDPIGAGLVKSFARPDGNVTGFSNLSELEISGK